MFNEYAYSDGEVSSDDEYWRPLSFTRQLGEDNKYTAITAAEAREDATALRNLILKSALIEAQGTAVRYFRSYFDTSVRNNSPNHPLLGDLRILATEIEAAYRPELHGLNLVAFTIKQYTSDYVEQLTTANNMSAHSSLNP